MFEKWWFQSERDMRLIGHIAEPKARPYWDESDNQGRMVDRGDQDRQGRGASPPLPMQSEPSCRPVSAIQFAQSGPSIGEPLSD